MSEQPPSPEHHPAGEGGQEGRAAPSPGPSADGPDVSQRPQLSAAERARRRRQELRGLEEMTSEARRVQAAVLTPSTQAALNDIARVGRAVEDAVAIGNKVSEAARSVLVAGAVGRQVGLTAETVLPGALQSLRGLQLAINPQINFNPLGAQLQQMAEHLSGARTAALVNAARGAALVNTVDWSRIGLGAAQHSMVNALVGGAFDSLQRSLVDLSAFQRSVISPWQEQVRSMLRGLRLPDLRWLEEVGRAAQRRRLAVLAAAKRAREAAVRGEKAAVEYFLTHWLRQSPCQWRHEALVTVLLEADWLLGDTDVEDDLLDRLRTDVTREGRNHKFLGETVLQKRPVDSLHRSVGAGRMLLDVADVAVDPVEDLALEGFSDPRLHSLFSHLDAGERRVVLLRGATSYETWESAAVAAGFSAAYGETVRRKVAALRKRVAMRQASAQRTRGVPANTPATSPHIPMHRQSE